MTSITPIWICALFMTLLGCQVAKKYERPALNIKNLYRQDSLQKDSLTMAKIPWYTLFSDTVLQRLIKEGTANNLDMKIAWKRLEQTQVLLWQSKMAFLPDLKSEVTLTQSRLAFPQGFGIIRDATQYNLRLHSTWEADIWGKLKSAKRKSLAALLQTEAAKNAIQTQLVAEIALAYFRLLILDEQLLILENTVENRRKDMKTLQSLKLANVVNGADVVQSEANYHAAEVAIPGIKRSIRETENLLSLLLAKPSSSIKRQTLMRQSLHFDPQLGVPSQLLQNRPDIQSAEQALWMSFEDEYIAKAQFYPSFNITASAGYTSYELKQWFSPSGFFANLMGGLAQPIFNRGANKARLEIANIKKDEAFLNFQKAILEAGEEVSNALFSYQTALEQQEIRSKQLQALEKAVTYNKKLLNYSSYTNYTDVLLAEQNLLAARLDQANDQWLKWESIIHLYQALGGGWNE